MLNREQLEALYLQHQYGLRTCKVIDRIRCSDPSRRVVSKVGNVSCRFSSRKMGVTIQAESHGNELAALYLWEHDPTVHEFYDQPEPIKLSYTKANGRNIGVNHTADYFLISDDFVGWVECKTEDELKRLAQKYPERFQLKDGEWVCPPGQVFAAQFGLGYRIRSSNETDWTLVRNLHFLQDYLIDDEPPVSSQEREIAKQLFSEKAGYSLFELLHAHPELPSDAIYYLIADETLYVDLTATPLSDSTNVTVYRDAVAAECMRSLSVTTSRVPTTPTLTFEPGSTFSWKGSAWKVTHQGEDHIDIVSTEGELLALSWTSIDELLARGELVGVATAMSEGMPQALLAEKIAKSSKDMLSQAYERLQMLNGHSPSRHFCARTVRKYRRRFREAEATYGNGFVGLIARTNERGNRNRKVSDAVIDLMHQTLREHYFNAKQPCLEIAYGELLLCCDEQGLTAPSIKTFSKERRAVYGPHQEKRLREGRKAAYSLEELVWSAKGGFPPHGERPFDIAHIDHTEVDLMLKDGAEESSVSRAWLSVMIDAYSRVVLAYYMSYDPPNYTNCMMLIRQCVERHQRLPATIVVDGGKEFSSQYFEVLLASFNINKKTRPPHSPRFGSVMERLFGTLNEKLWHNLQGNTKLLRDPRACSATHDPRRLAVWTLERLEVQFEKWLAEVYHVSNHTTLQAKPIEVFQAGVVEFGARKQTRLPYTREFIICCLPGVKANTLKVHVGRGVTHYGKWYWHAAFRRPELAGAAVEARYDPFDLSSIYAFIDGAWLHCQSQDAHLNEHMTERQLRYVTSVFRHFKKSSEFYQKVNARTAAQFYRGLREEEAELQSEESWMEEVEEPHDMPEEVAASHVAATQVANTRSEYPTYGDF